MSDDHSLESRLVGWKRIANHLGCSERTARRWEREEQLPVHRQKHDKRSTVFALPGELDTWLGNRADLSNESGNGAGSERSNGFALVAVSVVAIAVIVLVAIWPRAPLQPPDTARDPVAVDLYERGVAMWQQRGEEANRQAVKLLTQAVKRDDSYAEAWSALSSAWLTLPTYSDEVSYYEAADEALLAADRALQLDATLVESRSVMATIATGRGEWLTAERIYRDALAVDPNNTSLMLWFAGHYRELGMIDKAMELTDVALQLEPNSPPLLAETAMNHYQLGKFEQARSKLDYLWFELGVEFPIVWTGRWFAAIDSGDFDGARALLDKTPFKPFAPSMQSYIAFRETRVTEPTALADELGDAFGNGMPGWLAFHMLDQAGLTDAALDILEQESADGYFDNSVVLFFEHGGEARKRAEFAVLLERLGFYEYWRSRGSPDLCAREPDTPMCRRITESGDSG